jgi:hypothetical protein
VLLLGVERAFRHRRRRQRRLGQRLPLPRAPQARRRRPCGILRLSYQGGHRRRRHGWGGARRSRARQEEGCRPITYLRSLSISIRSEGGPVRSSSNGFMIQFRVIWPTLCVLDIWITGREMPFIHCWLDHWMNHVCSHRERRSSRSMHWSIRLVSNSAPFLFHGEVASIFFSVATPAPYASQF